MLTDEELELIAQEEELLLMCDGLGEFKEIARAIESAALAKLREQEPVAWITSDGLVKLLTTISCWTLVQKSEDAGFDTPLYTNPAPIPEGMVLVPVEPTEAMLKIANDKVLGSGLWREGYKAMLAAARG